MYSLLKFASALVMLFIIGFLSLVFGFWGFITGVVFTLIISNMYSRQEKEKMEKRRHEELLQAMQKKS